MSTTVDVKELNAKAEGLLPALKEELGDVVVKDIPDEHLLKFLRWKPNVTRAARRFKDHLKWKSDNPGLFDETLRVSSDDELERVLQSEVIVAPSECQTKDGGPVIIGRLRNNDMKDGRTTTGVCRMAFYTIDRVLESPEAQLHGVTLVHDLRGFDRSSNVHLDIPKTLFGGIIGNFPIRIKAIYIYQAPWGFSTFFKMVSMMLLPGKVRSRCYFINDLSELDSVMDTDLLIEDVGGKLKFDMKEWIEGQKQREQSGSIVTMTDMKAST